MKLKLFMKKTNAQNDPKINSIKEEFINMGCEKYFLRLYNEESSDMKKTEKLLSSLPPFEPLPIIIKFMNQFHDIDLKKQIPFIYPQKNTKNFYIINAIVEKYGISDVIIKNIFDDDETINHFIILDINDIFNIAMIHKLVYSACFGDNFGGYKIYNKDLTYYAEFTEYNGFVLSYSKPNDFVHYQGCTFCRDNDPFKILNVRKNIKHIIETNYFGTELDLFLSIYNNVFPIFQSWWEMSNNIYLNSDFIKIKNTINIIYSDLVANNIINSKWLNEKSLFQVIRKKYKNALFQHSPKWLSPQSFDIFIPELNVAIEYQGIQHLKEIEYFGGKEGFEHRKKLDLNKRKLAKDNGIILIEWFYNEPINIETLNEKLNNLHFRLDT